jgi:LuxR family maltose regulon positive regulatory protein
VHADPVLVAKLFAPPRRRQLVARPRLLRRLDVTPEAGHRLTVVSALAGFGKTTLPGDWLGTLEQHQTPPGVGWLSLDADDNGLERFLTHLVAAFESVGLDVDSAVLHSMHAAPSACLTAPVNELAHAVERLPVKRWVLVLDDYHTVEAPEVHEAVTFLLAHLPQQMHLVLATRSDPPLPLAQLRSWGQLTEVHAADLRFVLTRQPTGVRDFLLGTAVLDRLTGPLCDAVTGRADGTRMLEDLERANLFLVRSTRGVAGTGTTICSSTSCALVCSPSTRSRCRLCTNGPARGTPRPTSWRIRSGTPWPPMTSPEPPI